MGVISTPSTLSCVRLFLWGGSEISQIHNNIGKKFEFMTVIGSTVQWREEDANQATSARILSWCSRGICAMIFDTGWIPWELRCNLRFDLNLRFLEEIYLATMWRAACKLFSISSQSPRSGDSTEPCTPIWGLPSWGQPATAIYSCGPSTSRFSHNCKTGSNFPDISASSSQVRRWWQPIFHLWTPQPTSLQNSKWAPQDGRSVLTRQPNIRGQTVERFTFSKGCRSAY